MCVYPERQGDFEFEPMIQRVKAGNPCLRFCISLPQLSELIARKPELQKSELQKIRIDPTDPCIFQLSGGTTGIPKLIPRSHNDYAYNSKTAAPVCGVTRDSVLLVALPIAHNLPLACPGIQGYFFQGARGGGLAHPRPEELFGLIEKHPGDAYQGRAGAAHPHDQRSVHRPIRPFFAEGHSERWPAHAAGVR